MIKTLIKVGTEGIYLNTRKPTYDKPIANIILNRQKICKSLPTNFFPDLVKLGKSCACLLP